MREQEVEKLMIRTFTRQLLSTTLSFLLLTATTPFEAGAQQAAPTWPTGYSGQAVPLSAEDLQALVAPIALYPDALLAQVLAAATFPDQVAYGSNWLLQNTNLTGMALTQAVDAQPWDPSVKALTQFPSVLDNMAKNLSWTSALGEAYHTQTADVMSAVQLLRAKAQAAGNLKSSPEVKIVQESPQVIVIQPANPQVVYVPVYSPTVVYGYAYVIPGYYAPPPPPSAVAVAFGVGIAVGVMAASSSWGYSSWNCNWHSTTIVYRGGAYYGNPAWHGGSYYGTNGSGGVAHYGTSYNPSTGTYARGGTVSNGYGSVSAGQAYNPKTGAYGSTVQGSNGNGSWGSSTVSKNGNTAYSQHQTTSNGTTGSVQTSNGGSAYGASGKYGNSAAVGQTSNGNKYATANGNTYSNTGNGWSGSSNNSQKSYSNTGNGSSGSSNYSQKSYSNTGNGSSGSSNYSAPRHSTVEAGAGNPGLTVHAVLQAPAVSDEAKAPATNDFKIGQRCWKDCLMVDLLEDKYVVQNQRNHRRDSADDSDAHHNYTRCLQQGTDGQGVSLG